MSYGQAIREEFAKTYARIGNATHALKLVLGEERAAKMKPHTLRAKASTLLNDYRTVELIERHKAEMLANGEKLPHYRGRTERTDLFNEATDIAERMIQQVESAHAQAMAKHLAKVLKRLKRRNYGVV